MQPAQPAIPVAVQAACLTCQIYMCSTEASRTIAEEAQLFKITVSFGSLGSAISLPCYMSHASIPAKIRAARGLPDDLVRISVGIEDPQDLLEGLLQDF
jgi:cystathionine beta-lyase